MKVKKKQVWKHKGTGEEIRVSRLRKDEIFYHPKAGGGKEKSLKRETFLHSYQPVE